MAQVNFQLETELLETIKETAKASGMTMSELMRRALLDLPLGDDGTVSDTVARKRSGFSLDELGGRIERQEGALVVAAKVLQDLVRRLGGEGVSGEISWSGLFGLSKRETFAALSMMGRRAHSGNTGFAYSEQDTLAMASFRDADEMLEESKK